VQLYDDANSVAEIAGHKSIRSLPGPHQELDRCVFLDNEWQQALELTATCSR